MIVGACIVLSDARHLASGVRTAPRDIGVIKIPRFAKKKNL